MDEDTKQFLKFAGICAGITTVSMLILVGAGYTFEAIEDSIKFNRYQDAMKEYRQCAQKYQDSLSVRLYCGDEPSSTMML
jgi:hypothetical protein